MKSEQGRPELLSVPQAARYCGVSRNTMYTWVKSGKLRAAVTPGRTNIIRAHDLLDFMNECGLDATPELIGLVRNRGGVPAEEERAVERAELLVVDDDSRNRDLIRRALDSRSILEAETGFEALHLATQHPEIKAVLLDLRMPGQHGLQTLKELRRLIPTVKVVVITAFSGEVPTSLLINGMISGILEKPFTVRDLVVTVENLLPTRA